MAKLIMQIVPPKPADWEPKFRVGQRVKLPATGSGGIVFSLPGPRDWLYGVVYPEARAARGHIYYIDEDRLVAEEG